MRLPQRQADDVQPERAKPVPRVAPARLTAVSAVLALQRSAGNAATAALLMRQDAGGATAPAATPEERYEALRTDGRWDEAARVLSELPDEAVRRRVEDLQPGPRAAMLLSGPADTRVRLVLLEAEIKDGTAAGDWRRVAMAFNGFNASDIAARVGALAPEGRVKLWMGAHDAYPRVYEAIATLDPKAAYEAAVEATAWGRAAVYLEASDDATLTERAKALTREQRSSIRAAGNGERARVALQKADVEDAIRDGDWARAAELLNDFNDTDVDNQIKAIASERRVDLWVAAQDKYARICDSIARSDPRAALDAAIRATAWGRAAVYLEAADDATLKTRAKALTPEQRSSIRAAGDGTRMRTALLSADLEEAIDRGNWAKATELLNGFNDADIDGQIDGLLPERRVDLWVAAHDKYARISDAIARIDPQAAFDGALKATAWERAGAYLDAADDAALKSRARALTPEQRGSIRATLPDTAHRARTALLHVELEAVMTAGEWGKAVELLNTFSEPDIGGQLKDCAAEHRVDLWVAAHDTYPRIYDAIATIDPEAAYAAAVKATAWGRAAAYLEVADDDTIKSRAQALDREQRASIRAALNDAAHRARKALLEVDLDAAMTAGEWAKAAELLNAFTDEDIAEWALGLPPDRRAAMLAAAPPARVRTALVRCLLEDAITAGKWADAANLLGELTDVEITTRVEALNPDQRRLLMAAAREHGSPALFDRIAGDARSGPGPTPAAGQVFGRTGFSQSFLHNTTPHGSYVSPIRITFDPDPAVCVCDDIGFVQTVRIVDTGTNHNRDPIVGQRDRLNDHQEAVDRFPHRSIGYYGRTNADTAESHLHPGHCPPPEQAWMTDRPEWNQPNLTWEFETAVVARSGPQANLVYSTVRWGFTVDAHKHLTAIPHTIHDRQSSGFDSAVEKWNEQASGPARGRAHPDQQPLPSFH